VRPPPKGSTAVADDPAIVPQVLCSGLGWFLADETDLQVKLVSRIFGNWIITVDKSGHCYCFFVFVFYLNNDAYDICYRHTLFIFNDEECLLNVLLLKF
jgi:hypothetical protein